MTTLKDFKEKKMQNSEFAKAFEVIQPEIDAIRAEIDQRIAQEKALKESNSIQD